MNFESALIAENKEKRWFENCFKPVEKSRAKDLTGYIFKRDVI